MSHLPASFAAFVAHEDGQPQARLTTLTPDDLDPGEVTIRVEWSGVNYKDALAVLPDGKVAQRKPLVPGIDLAGTVVDGPSDLPPGTPVLAHGYGIGVSHHGGYAEYARLPAAWVLPLPDGLDARAAMTIGTAGFTAGLSVSALESHGLRPGTGPVLVTGASGGVGGFAVALLAARGYEVVASTGSTDSHAYLEQLGANEIIGREELTSGAGRALERERWAGAVDSVGGQTLAGVLRTLRQGSAVAASGNTGGPELATTVFPFILRAAALLGIDSVTCSLEAKREVWAQLARDLDPGVFEAIGTRVAPLSELPEVLSAIMSGEVRGRALIEVAGSR